MGYSLTLSIYPSPSSNSRTCVCLCYVCELGSVEIELADLPTYETVALASNVDIV